MKERAIIKIGAMIDVAKRQLDKDPFWKVDDINRLIDSELREIETLEYIYNLIQNDNE